MRAGIETPILAVHFVCGTKFYCVLALRKDDNHFAELRMENVTVHDTYFKLI